MSHTVSRGYHTVEQWRTVAITTKEQLNTSMSKQVGAWTALEQFFTWTLEGLGKEPRKAPLMAGLCSLSIAYKVLEKLNGKVSLNFVEKKARKYLRITQESRGLTKTRTRDVRELRRFLTELARQGAS